MRTRHIAALYMFVMLTAGISTQAIAQEAPVQPTTAHKEAQAPLTLTTQDYGRRARAALDEGNPLLAAQILMLNYQDHGEAQGLYVAGMAFEQAGRMDLAIKAWSIFICESADADRVQALRERLRSARVPQPCLAPPPDAKQGLQTDSRARPSPSYSERPMKPETAAVSDESALQDLQVDFEFETGIRIGDSFALTWAPGLWFGHDGTFRFGFFVPLMLGDGQASIGLEARSRVGLQAGISGEISLGLHRVEHFADTSTSFGAGINFQDALTIGFRRQSFGRATNYVGGDFSANFLDATFTGKTGTTITAIEAGLALLVFGLAASSN